MFGHLFHIWCYFLNHFNLFNDLRRGWWYFIIDNIISKYINFLIRHFANGVSINFLFWLAVLFFCLRLVNFIIMQLNLSTSSLLIKFIITYHAWFPSLSSPESSDTFPRCCECWLPRIRLSLHYERRW